MLKISNGIVPVWYTSKADKSGETAFLIKPLSSADRLNVAGLSSKHTLGDTILMAVKSAVTDWKGITDADNKPLAFTTDGLETLPAHVLAELSREIMDSAALSEAERKN